MSFIAGVLLFFINFALVIVLLTRTTALPSKLLVLAPTALARRFLRRLERDDGKKSVFDINVNAENLNTSLSSPKAQLFVVLLCIAGFALSQQWVYLLLAGGFGTALVTGSNEKPDERSFEQFTRALAAVGDAVLFGVLFFVAIFRFQTDAFTLLAFMFMAREILFVFAKRWLESDPEFLPYDDSGNDDKSGVQVSGEKQRIGVFVEKPKDDAPPSNEAN
jgi:hypothetical protein